MQIGLFGKQVGDYFGKIGRMHDWAI